MHIKNGEEIPRRLFCFYLSYKESKYRGNFERIFSFFDPKAYLHTTSLVENGKRCAEHHTLAEKKAYYNDTLMHFSPSERRLINPHYYKVDISDDLYNLKMGIINRIVNEIKNFKL